MKDEEQERYNDVQVHCFGLMDPCDWAAELSSRLLVASKSVHAARDRHGDPAKELTQFTEAESLAAIRSGVSAFLGEMHVMLHSMPMMQMQPEILETLRFILAGVADIDRGVRADWLAAKPTKKHPKRLEQEAEWVPIIAALELLLFDPSIFGDDGAAREIVRRTGRRLGTIKDWHQRLFRKGEQQRPAAWAAIRDEVQQMRALLSLAEKERRAAIIERRVSELLS